MTIIEEQLEQYAIQWFQDTGWDYANGEDMPRSSIFSKFHLMSDWKFPVMSYLTVCPSSSPWVAATAIAAVRALARQIK